MTNNNIETEIKFKLPNPQELRQKLRALGAKNLGRIKERNVKFDTPDKKIGHQGKLLRLRQDQRIRLTVKGVAQRDKFKTRPEIEIVVNDFTQTKKLLELLGFHPVFIYEKFRETWRYKNTEIVIDEFPQPFDTYLEIEGNKKAIRQAVSDLGLDLEQGINKSYSQLFKNKLKALNKNNDPTGHHPKGENIIF